MKTIEERAKEVGTLSQFRSDYPYDKRSIMVGYIRGAADQKAIDIDKACKWLDGYLMDIGYPDDWMRDSPNIESGKERFRKAMVE